MVHSVFHLTACNIDDIFVLRQLAKSGVGFVRQKVTNSSSVVLLLAARLCKMGSSTSAHQMPTDHRTEV